MINRETANELIGLLKKQKSMYIDLWENAPMDCANVEHLSLKISQIQRILNHFENEAKFTVKED